MILTGAAQCMHPNDNALNQWQGKMKLLNLNIPSYLKPTPPSDRLLGQSNSLYKTV